MYLKRLELHGFKTFAARTSLDFERGVTAVVGPNGSGKSNLADAVRWALGEQNPRNVRCRHAEELIFAGAAGQGARDGARPPMGMAEVLLTFDNAGGWLPIEFGEVRIGRRLYRTGETEYLLNGARVRLRDITDLLARASINAGGHLVIGQGLIDTVLSLRPEERRSLIETLAGLRFYYSRREEAEAKLRATEANLRHVDAMIAEATPLLASLQEQAAAYAQYHEVERELRDLLLLQYAHSYGQAQEKRARAAAELEAMRATLATTTAAARDAEQALSTAREQARLLDGQAAALRGELRAAHEARETAERDLAVSQARRVAAVARRDDLRANLPPLRDQRAAALAEMNEAGAAVKATDTDNAQQSQKRAEAERAARAANDEIAAAERSSRALAERRRALESQQATTGAELGALEREQAAAQAEDRRQTMDEQATSLGARRAAEALAAARQALDAAMAGVDDARAAEGAARLLAAESAEQARLAATAHRDAQRHADDLGSRAGGLRAWLKAAAGGAEPGTMTVMGSLLTTDETGPAVAAALGPLLAARTVTAELDAPAAATLLADGARGVLLPARAGLTSHDQSRVELYLRAAGLGDAALLGWGDALAGVEAGADASGAIRAALSLVLVVRDLEAAWQAHAILRAIVMKPEAGEDMPPTSTHPTNMHPTNMHPTGIRAPAPAVRAGMTVMLATPAGEALWPSGLLQRPAAEGAAALERARELRVVEAAAERAATALDGATAAADEAEKERLVRAAAAEAALRALRAAEHQRDARRSDLATAEKAQAQARREAEWATDRLRRAAEAAAERTVRHAETVRRHAEATEALAALATEEAPAAARVEAARRALQAAAARRAEHVATAALLAERVTMATRRQRAAQEALSRLEGDLQTRETALARLEQEAAALAAREDALTTRAGQATQRIRELHEQLRPLETKRAALDERALELERRLAALRPEEARAVAQREVGALALQRADHDIASVTAGIEADLALDPADLPPAAPPPFGAQSRLKALRVRLTAFGPVNARAPDDLAAITTRMSFLQGQSGDLREGMARLRGIITEANATVRDRFSTVTAELDAQFRLYLRQLFGGGQGELTALYDEAGLPSGLDIAAQPPGKKTRELALLSGGERALAGLALVFAMLAVRPVPFCVLDEAEAALDEANTLRVGEILRSLGERTQFIVITHNRGTMSYADALYGVTMAGSGVTQIAGLRLEDVRAARQSRAG